MISNFSDSALRQRGKMSTETNLNLTPQDVDTESAASSGTESRLRGAVSGVVCEEGENRLNDALHEKFLSVILKGATNTRGGP